jgi:hypothetical protein
MKLVKSDEAATEPKLRHQPPSGRFWNSLAAVWRHRTTVIAVFAAVAIVVNLILRFAFHMSPGAYQIPLLATLALGGIPLVLELLQKLFAATGHLSPVAGAICQEIIDALAVLNALRAAFPPKVISDLHDG